MTQNNEFFREEAKEQEVDFAYSSLEKVRNRLIDLSRSNRLINFKPRQGVCFFASSLEKLGNRFSTISKISTIEGIPKLTFADLDAYLSWLDANPSYTQAYGLVAKDRGLDFVSDQDRYTLPKTSLLAQKVFYKSNNRYKAELRSFDEEEDSRLSLSSHVYELFSTLPLEQSAYCKVAYYYFEKKLEKLLSEVADLQANVPEVTVADLNLASRTQATNNPDLAKLKQLLASSQDSSLEAELATMIEALQHGSDHQQSLSEALGISITDFAYYRTVIRTLAVSDNNLSSEALEATATPDIQETQEVSEVLDSTDSTLSLVGEALALLSSRYTLLALEQINLSPAVVEALLLDYLSYIADKVKALEEGYLAYQQSTAEANDEADNDLLSYLGLTKVEAELLNPEVEEGFTEDNDGESLLVDSGNKTSLKDFVADGKLTPALVFKLLIMNQEARSLYFANRDMEAQIPQLLEEQINLTSYAAYKYQLLDIDLGLTEELNNNPDLLSKKTLPALAFSDKLYGALDKLEKKNHLSEREMGAGILYLCFGFLEYLDSKNSSLAPLYLVPVDLKRVRKTSKDFAINYTGEPILENVSLHQKLLKDYGYYLPKIKIKDNLAQEAMKIAKGLPSIYSLEEIEALESKVGFDDEYSLVEYLELVESFISSLQLPWKIHYSSFLSAFQFAKQRMYLDLDSSLWPANAALEDNTIIKALFNEKTGIKDYHSGLINEEYDIDNIDNIHRKYPLVNEADSSQHSALIDVIDGKNIVIEGPPGSGKSQTITNIIAAAMMQGKRVLFVAEKMAALEVVHRRLDEMGLSIFCLEMHQAKALKKKVVSSILERLETFHQFKKPENFDNLIQNYENYKNELNNYAYEINKEFGESGFTNQEILAAAAVYRSFNFAKGGIALLGDSVQENTQDFFTRYNYEQICLELRGFTKIINKVKQSLITQDRYLQAFSSEDEQTNNLLLRASQQEAQNSLYSLEKEEQFAFLSPKGTSFFGNQAQQLANQESRATREEASSIEASVNESGLGVESALTQDVEVMNSAEGLPSTELTEKTEEADAKAYTPAQLSLKNHLWYGMEALNLSGSAAEDVKEALFAWQKNLVGMKNFLVSLLEQEAQNEQRSEVASNLIQVNEAFSFADYNYQEDSQEKGFVFSSELGAGVETVIEEPVILEAKNLKPAQKEEELFAASPLANLDLLSLEVLASQLEAVEIQGLEKYFDGELYNSFFADLQDRSQGSSATANSDKAIEEAKLNLYLDYFRNLDRDLRFAQQAQDLFNFSYLEKLAQLEDQDPTLAHDLLQNKNPSTKEEEDRSFLSISGQAEAIFSNYSVANCKEILAHSVVGAFFKQIKKQYSFLEQKVRHPYLLENLQNLAKALTVLRDRFKDNEVTVASFLQNLTDSKGYVPAINYQTIISFTKLLEKLPPHLIPYIHLTASMNKLLMAYSQDLYNRIQTLSRSYSSLMENYDISYINSYEDLVSLRETLLDHKPNLLKSFFDKNYRVAKERWQKILGSNEALDESTQRNLFALFESYFRAVKSLEEDQTFQGFFGGLYQGMATNFNDIETLISWSEEVRYFCHKEFHNGSLYNIFVEMTPDKFLETINLGKMITHDYEYIGQAGESVNTFLTVNVFDMNIPEFIAQTLYAIKSLLKLVRKDFGELNLELILNDALALHYKAQEEESLAVKAVRAELDLLDRSFVKARELNLTELYQLLTTEDIKPSAFVRTLCTTYLAQKFVALGELLTQVAELSSPLREQESKELNLSALIQGHASSASFAQALLAQDIVKPSPLLPFFGSFRDFERLSFAQAGMAKLSANIRGARQAYLEFADLVALNEKAWLGKRTKSLLNLIIRNQMALDSTDGLVEWLDYLVASRDLNNLGIGKILDYAEALPNLGEDTLVDLFSQIFFNFLASVLINHNPVLRNFSSMRHNKLIQNFDQADAQLKMAQREFGAYQIDQRAQVPPGYVGAKVSDYTEMALLEYLSQHPTMRASLRDIILRAGNSLQALKPCFMMSPATVSQYLTPGHLQFDLLVMDEASQVTPEDALGAIARCKQVCIVGDPKQLPPTTFFSIAKEEDEDDSLLVKSESILDIASTMFPTRVLRWHYRSQHESLIAFSNQQYYNSNLVIFPSPYNNHQDYGIKYNYVEGYFNSKKGNLPEAQALAQAMAQHLKEKTETLGVVAMNKVQATLIEKEFEKLLSQDKELQQAYARDSELHESLFIKNLENVQGDERDVIMISTTYGPRKLGDAKVPQRFGPINQNIGGRRLNVLFTRSKKRMVIFTSLKAQDIHSRASHDESGVNDFKLFLEYAERGILSSTKDVSSQRDLAVNSLISKTLVNIMSLRYKVTPNIGVTGYKLDLAFSANDSNTYLLGLETDGKSYAQARSCRDRDRLRGLVLRRLGWNLERLWTMDWYKFSQKEICTSLDRLLVRYSQEQGSEENLS